LYYPNQDWGDMLERHSQDRVGSFYDNMPYWIFNGVWRLASQFEAAPGRQAFGSWEDYASSS
jgi:hypothetical protein